LAVFSLENNGSNHVSLDSIRHIPNVSPNLKNLFLPNSQFPSTAIFPGSPKNDNESPVLPPIGRTKMRGNAAGRSVSIAWTRLLAVTRQNPETVPALHEALTSFLAELDSVPSEPDSSQVSRAANELERRRVEARLTGFDPTRSRAWADIRSRFGDSLNQMELRSLAEVVGAEIGVKVDREAKRRKEVLIKWFDENYALMEPVLEKIQMEDSNGRLMTGDT
jgi:hypothetical protein